MAGRKHAHVFLSALISYNPNFPHISSTFAFTSALISMRRPHSRLVSGGIIVMALHYHALWKFGGMTGPRYLSGDPRAA